MVTLTWHASKYSEQKPPSRVHPQTSQAFNLTASLSSVDRWNTSYSLKQNEAQSPRAESTEDVPLGGVYVPCIYMHATWELL